jgi:hypothetical protein
MQARQFGRMQQASAEPPKDGFARDGRTVGPRRASRQRLVDPLGSTNDPATYRKQQRHPGDRQSGRTMVRSLMNGSPEVRHVVGTHVDTAAQEETWPIRRQMHVHDVGRAGSRKLPHYPARRRIHQRK